MLEKLSEVTFVLQRWAVCKKGPQITNFQIGGLAKFVRLTDLPQMSLSRGENLRIGTSKKFANLSHVKIMHKNCRFSICGLSDLRNLWISNSGMSPRICRFALCGLKNHKFACPPLLVNQAKTDDLHIRYIFPYCCENCICSLQKWVAKKGGNE
jgi:hypothetical protein